MADTVPAMLEPGEYVIRKDAVDKIGVENLDMMNNIDRSSQMYMSHGGLVPQLQNAHSAIDELLALNTLANQDNVDMTRESSMMNKGGQLKPIPKDNKGLGKLPATVRNRMGYMQEGGAVQDNTMSNLMNLLALKEIADKSPQLSMYDADTRGGIMGQDDPLGISEGNFIPVAGVLSKGVSKLLKQSELAKKAKERYIDLQKQILTDNGLLGKSGIRKLKKEMDEELMPLIETRYRNPSGVVPTKNLPNFNKGGKVPKDPDPLQIDARMRGEFKDVGTIGVVNPKRNMMSELSKLQDDISMIKFLRERFKDNPENMRAQIKVRELPNMEDIMEILNEASKMTKPKNDTIRGYQNGGQVFSFGSQTTETPMLEDIYRMAGLRPVGEQAGNFQQYDASREEGVLADYSRGVQNLRSQGTGALGQASLRAQNMGGGFAGFGGRQASQDALRRQAGMQYQSGLEQAGQRRFETIRGMREQFIGDTIAQLGQLEGAEGTQTVRQPAREVSQLPTTDEGDVTYNGTRYVFYQGQYITESELDNIMEEEQDRSGDGDLYYD